jgi:glucose 1-dehydrogenase
MGKPAATDRPYLPSLSHSFTLDQEYIVKVPAALREVGVLLEPTSIAEKGIEQAYEIQRRLKV